MRKIKGENIESFVKRYKAQCSKEFGTNKNQLDPLNLNNKQKFENALRVTYAITFTTTLLQIKDKLGPELILEYDHRLQRQEDGMSAEIRFSRNYETDLTLTFVGSYPRRKASLIITSSDFVKLSGMKTEYEFTLAEMTDQILEDLITKILTAFYLDG